MTQLTRAERIYLSMGKKRPSGKLPIFDELGQQISETTVRSCLRKGLAEPWFANPIKPDWLVCRLTEQGREAV